MNRVLQANACTVPETFWREVTSSCGDAVKLDGNEIKCTKEVSETCKKKLESWKNIYFQEGEKKAECKEDAKYKVSQALHLNDCLFKDSQGSWNKKSDFSAFHLSMALMFICSVVF